MTPLPQGVLDSGQMEQEESSRPGIGDIPSCTITWEWGRDEADGTRIDRYVGNDGYLYERTIPKGGGYCPEVQGIVPGREPVWKRVGRIG